MADISLTPVRRGRLVVDEGYLFEDVGLGTATTPDPVHERVECPVYNVVVKTNSGAIKEVTLNANSGDVLFVADGA